MMFIKNIILITSYGPVHVPLLWTLYYHNLTVPTYSCLPYFSVID